MLLIDYAQDHARFLSTNGPWFDCTMSTDAHVFGIGRTAICSSRSTVALNAVKAVYEYWSGPQRYLAVKGEGLRMAAGEKNTGQQQTIQKMV